MGGWPHAGGRKVGISIGEKGLAWRRLPVQRHARPRLDAVPGRQRARSRRPRSSRRLAAYRPQARLDELWAARLEVSGLPEPVRQGLLDPDRLLDTLAALPPATAKLLHACTHTTISPNVLHGGIKTNVIPDTVDLDVDIRTLPGVTGGDVDGYLREALGDLAEEVEVSSVFDDEASASPTRTPLWDILDRADPGRVPRCRAAAAS